MFLFFLLSLSTFKWRTKMKITIWTRKKANIVYCLNDCVIYIVHCDFFQYDSVCFFLSFLCSLSISISSKLSMKEKKERAQEPVKIKIAYLFCDAIAWFDWVWKERNSPSWPSIEWFAVKVATSSRQIRYAIKYVNFSAEWPCSVLRMKQTTTKKEKET